MAELGVIIAIALAVVAVVTAVAAVGGRLRHGGLQWAAGGAPRARNLGHRLGVWRPLVPLLLLLLLLLLLVVVVEVLLLRPGEALQQRVAGGTVPATAVALRHPDAAGV